MAESVVPLWTQACRFPVVLLLCTIVLAVALNITTERMPDPKTYRPLPDMGHELLPKMSELEHVTDMLMSTMVIFLFVLVFKLYQLHRVALQLVPLDETKYLKWVPWPLNVIVLRPWFGHAEEAQDPFPRRNAYLIAWIRFWTAFSVLSLFRAPVIMLTSMPATDNKCQAAPKILSPLENIVLTIITFGSGSIHCGDLMFSGHTVMITLSFISLWTYGPFIGWWLRPLGFTFMSLTWVTIIASRSHYTDDIVVAIYLTISTYWVLQHTDVGAPRSLQRVISWWPDLTSIPETLERLADRSEEEHSSTSPDGGPAAHDVALSVEIPVAPPVAATADEDHSQLNRK